MAQSETQEAEIDGRVLRLSNQNKVMYPATGTTKGEVVEYYSNIASVMLPHLRDRPITLKRYPNGVEGSFFYEKQCPKHKPDWIRTASVEASKKTIDYCLIESRAGLMWLANLASIEVHPLLALRNDVQQPTKITFDLDPGEPATIVECAQVALMLQELFAQLGIQIFPKTSGSKGMQVEVPLNVPITYEETKPFAKAIALLTESQHPKRVVSRMEKALRKGKVFIDWSQNHDTKTTICAYSLRARTTPTVSTPVTWDEVQAAADGEVLSFTATDVLARVEKLGDLQEPVLTLQQELPKIG